MMNDNNECLLRTFIDCVRRDNTAAVASFVKNGFDLSFFGDDLLLLAAENRNLNVLKWFIEEKYFDINHVNLDETMCLGRNSSEHLPVFWSVGTGSVATLLLGGYCLQSEEEKSKVWRFLNDVLLPNGYDIKTNQYSLLSILIGNQETNFVKNYITDHFEDFFGKTLNSNLLMSAVHHNPEMAQWLIERGVDINSQNSQPLREACERKNFEMIKLLVEYGAIINIMPNSDYNSDCPSDDFSYKNSALSMVCSTGNLEIIDYFFKHGADINLGDRHLFKNNLSMPLPVWEYLIKEQNLSKDSVIENYIEKRKSKYHSPSSKEIRDVFDIIEIKKQQKELNEELALVGKISKLPSHKI